jgi:RNA polymerase sigma factor (TIGR02999 family)
MRNDADEAELGSIWKELYPELKRLARARLRRSGPNTLLETAGLVNEAYLRVSGGAADLRAASPEKFLAYAARAMRSVVIDMVRERQALRRGGDLQAVTLDTAIIEGLPAAEDTPLRIDEALQELAALEPRLARVVEMRYFGGFTEAEIAASLGVTDRTLRRDWLKASALLRAMLQPHAG